MLGVDYTTMPLNPLAPIYISSEEVWFEHKVLQFISQNSEIINPQDHKIYRSLKTKESQLLLQELLKKK
jgi:hypothetical protein